MYSSVNSSQPFIPLDGAIHLCLHLRLKPSLIRVPSDCYPLLVNVKPTNLKLSTLQKWMAEKSTIVRNVELLLFILNNNDKVYD